MRVIVEQVEFFGTAGACIPGEEFSEVPGDATETTPRYVESSVVSDIDLYEIIGATCCNKLGLEAESLRGTHSTEVPPMIEAVVLMGLTSRGM